MCITASKSSAISEKGKKMEKRKGTTLFRIFVIVLLAANLAVSSLVYVRLGCSGQDISKETGAVSEGTVKAADSAEKAAVPETPETPETASGGEVSYSYIYELDGSPASRTAAQTPADYSADNDRDLAALRCDAGFEIEVFEGVYWVSASALGKTRFTNAQVYRLLSDTPEEKQAEISTLYEALQLYQIGDFRSADDNIRVEENGIDWEYHTPGRLAAENNSGCCAADSAWLRYILDGDYDELGYISTSQRDGSGHIYNYIRDGEWYYIIDLTHYRNDADIGLTTVIENGDIDSYMRSDRVLGNIHRTKDLRYFVNYVQDAFNDPPGLMFRLTCENVPPIDGVSTGNGIAITHPESYEPYITCIFDDPSDTLTHTYAPDPTRDPYK